MNQSCIAALDGGGTKTLLVVLRQDMTISNIYRAEGSNPFDQPLWCERLSSLFARLPANTVAAGLGLAGFGESPLLSERQRGLVRETFRHIPHFLTNDVDLARNGAFAGDEGILLLSGTGSMAWGAQRGGKTCRVGGWGSLMGDEGSAFWIGRRALGIVTAILDERNTMDKTFLDPFLEAMGILSDPSVSLLSWYSNLTHERSEVAALSRIVAQQAELGCPTSCRLLREAAAELALHIHTARQKLSCPDLPWSYAGGTLQSVFMRNVGAETCDAPSPPRLSPVGGGLLTAARLAGWPVDDQWISTLAQTLREADLVL